MSTAKFNTWQNPDGTENYKCRAWVNFNGTGTVAIRAAGNVTSITDNGRADYTVNFTTAMPDANYATVIGSATVGGDNGQWIGTVGILSGTAPTTTAIRIGNAAIGDFDIVNVAIFR
jgi:hypothetical protein